MSDSTRSLSITREPKFIQIPLRIARDPLLTPSDKLLYGAMYWFSRKSGVCFASYGRIASITGLTERTIMRSVQKLLQKHLIEPAEGNFRGGFHDAPTKGFRCLVSHRIPKSKILAMPKPKTAS